MEEKLGGPEIIVFEDGMNSINDPLSVQLADGRIMMMFARFPYGRHARNSGWIKMAEPGYDDPKVNILTFVTYSEDDGQTWTEPVDITKSVKPSHWLNANYSRSNDTIRKRKSQRPNYKFIMGNCSC